MYKVVFTYLFYSYIWESSTDCRFFFSVSVINELCDVVEYCFKNEEIVFMVKGLVKIFGDLYG